jgi:hypothetical protein
MVAGVTTDATAEEMTAEGAATEARGPIRTEGIWENATDSSC